MITFPCFPVKSVPCSIRNPNIPVFVLPATFLLIPRFLWFLSFWGPKTAGFGWRRTLLRSMATWIHIGNRIPDPIHIQIPALHDGGDLRRIGIRFQAQFVFALVDLLGIIAVDAVRRVPVGVLLGKTADIGVIIPRAEVIGLCLAEISAVKYIAHAVRDRQLAIVAVLLRNNAVWHTHAAVGIQKNYRANL